MIFLFKIFRFDPSIDEKPYYENHSIEVDINMRILDCLNQIRWEHDPSLSYRWSCSHGICGSDGLTINGKASLACQKPVKDFEQENEIIIEPLSFFPIIKDLIVDMEPFFESMKSIHPEKWGKFSPVDFAEEIYQSPSEHEEIVDAIKCVMCGCCSASCPVNREEDSEYIGPAAVLRAKRYIFDTRLKEIQERMKIIEKPHGIWSCKTYWECTKVCPKSIRVTQNILNLKTKLLKKRSHAPVASF